MTITGLQKIHLCKCMRGMTMTNSTKRRNRKIAAMLTALFIAQQSMLLSVMATNITGIQGQNGVYNIEHQTKSGNIGFRSYDNFELSQGDIANLQFKDIQTFVNMVQNGIKIDGIVNTMKDSNFYNGKAVFVSPNGMVVGASGVLNVGSLGVYTPTQSNFDALKADQSELGLKYLFVSDSGANVTIDGKVLAAGDIDIDSGGKVAIGNTGALVGGINESKMTEITKNNAETLFNQLVNTGTTINKNQEFVSNNYGQITITSARGIDIQGNVKNFATGTKGATDNDMSNIHIHNYSSSNGDINISGRIENTKGLVQIDNNTGNLTLAKSGKILNDGKTKIFNTPFAAYGDVDNNTKLTLDGDIHTTGDLRIENKGQQGMQISGNIDHTGDAVIINGVAQHVADFRQH